MSKYDELIESVQNTRALLIQAKEAGGSGLITVHDADSGIDDFSEIAEIIKQARDREQGCDQCKEYENDFYFCPNCGKRLRELFYEI